jgi:hypothetical protein
MSQKKAADVNALLARGTEARKAGEINFSNIIASSKETIQRCELEYNSILKSLAAVQYKFSEEALIEFPTEIGQVEQQVTNTKSALQTKGYPIATIDNEVNHIERRLSELDREADDLREIVRIKQHYCDPEYAKADEIVNEYRKIAKMRNEIAERAKFMSSQASIDLLTAQNSHKQMEGLLESVAKLNQKAKAVIVLRQEAAKAKTFIANELKSIDERIAKKFMAQEYIQVQELSKAIMDMNDREILNQFKRTEEKISLFKNQLQQKYAAFEAERVEATAYVSEVEALREKDAFYHPMEYAKNRENAGVISLLTFLADYAKGEYIAEINDGIAKSQAELQTENFQAAKARADAVRTTIEKAVSYANLKQESILKNIFMAVDIRNVMRKLNYQTDTSIIDDDITKGFRITCKAGDELIDFEKVLVDEKGKVTMDIDHTESVSGNCGEKWGALQAEFAQSGIMIQDVLKNGRSVIKPDTVKGGSGMKDEGVGQKQ